ncbi:vacuolar protein sorting-associated protein 11 homolog [Scaptodrosophila lebanonensis]|uniref:Vacuolar protein sorting-associated protein 11 homolog n=1 Tax=Drosophila lebanonensis TaxID=7225 RepID=A0A6J2TTL6_DROLE|nr:vacuolar protein sorting-associated protein 11 homolog [Scaptodrosophila lebanonensis]
MSGLEWKKIDLIDLVLLPRHRIQNIKTEIVAQCSNGEKFDNKGSNTTVFCGKNGMIHVFFRNWEYITFKSQSRNEAPIKFCALTTMDVLATVTQENNCSVCIQVYDLRKLTKREGTPHLATTNLSPDSAVTSIQAECSEDGKLLALGIGFENGELLLHYGTVNSINFQRHVICLRPIIGIQFEMLRHQSDHGGLICNMFLDCIDKIFCYLLHEKGLVHKNPILDERTSKHNHSSTMHKPKGADEAYFVVGRDDAIYCFTKDEKGPCYAIEGQKTNILWVDNLMVVLLKNKKNIFTPLSSCVITVVDIENKIIIFNREIKNVLCITAGIASFYIITKDSSGCTYNIYILQELNTVNVIRLLTEKHMYDIALRILDRKGLGDSPVTAQVRFQYGNHLYSIGEVCRAASEYEKTIGTIKPYNVISKLLSVRNNKHLMLYLKKLVVSEHATNEHRKLLCNCTDRNKIHFNVHELCRLQFNTSSQNILHLGASKNIAIRGDSSFKMSNIELQMGENGDLPQLFLDSDEMKILELFADTAEDLLTNHSEHILKVALSLMANGRITDTLRFLTLFPDHPEFCSNVLSNVIEHDPNCNEKYYYYLLVLYLGLWRDKKRTEKFILQFLKNSPLRTEKAMVLCKMYLFSVGIKQFLNGNNETFSSICAEENIRKCINYLIKGNSDFKTPLKKDPSSLLFVLQSIFHNADIQVLHLRPLLMEESMKNVIDPCDEAQCVVDLNKAIEKYHSLLVQLEESPIEFRNTSCEKCHQVWKLPSLYFICQHSFHKDCYTTNKTSKCDICITNTEHSVKLMPTISLEAGDIVLDISKILAFGIFN